MNIFFSYTVRDGFVDRTALLRVRSQLEQFSSPYIDLLEHSSGGNQTAVWDALARAESLFLCVTPNILASPWVKLELSFAIKRGIAIYSAPLSTWQSMKRSEHPSTGNFLTKIIRKPPSRNERTDIFINKESPTCIVC